MAFYSPDAAMDQRLAALVQRLAGERGEALSSGLSITWLRYRASLLELGREWQEAAAPRSVAAPGSPGPARGACWQGARLREPGDLVQLAYLLASERWLQRGLLEEEPELRRAQLAMIRRGSHDATSYVVDRLSGTTSGPALAETSREAWMAQRLLVDGWLASLGWPELEGCHAAQKTWQDGPYGRERQFLGPALENANRFSTDGLARLLEGVLVGTLISPPACQRMRHLLAVPEHERGPDGPDPGDLAALLPPVASGWARFWCMGGRRPHSPGLALYGEGEGQNPVLLVVLADREIVEAGDSLLASIVSELLSPEAMAG